MEWNDLSCAALKGFGWHWCKSDERDLGGVGVKRIHLLEFWVAYRLDFS